MNMEQLQVINSSDEDDFTRRVTKELQEGWRVSSTHCGFVDSAAYDYCNSYQAILTRNVSKKIGPKIIQLPELIEQGQKIYFNNGHAGVFDRWMIIDHELWLRIQMPGFNDFVSLEAEKLGRVITTRWEEEAEADANE